MRNALLVLALIVGCTAIHKGPVKQVPVVDEVLNPEPIAVITPNVEVTPRGQLKLVPAVKYRVAVNGYDKYIPRVEKFFNLLVNDKALLDGRKFSYTTDDVDTIRKKIMEGFDVKIVSFRPKWYTALKWKYTIAYHDDWVIYLNSQKLNRPECEIINTLAHESTHAWGYGHGDDSPWNKEASFPYWVGNKAEELCLAGLL